MRITAAVMEEKSGSFKLDTVELDALRPDEVLVRIVATSICHTDLHARDGYFPMPYPGVYGHEGRVSLPGSEPPSTIWRLAIMS
jgi:aryl-alcohol dehydrogenase